jgi:predicted nucleic acid-binding protein
LLNELQKAPVASVPIGQYADVALALAGELAHPVYDCLYLAVAVANQTHVVTADRRFAALGNSVRMNDRIRLLAA